MRHPVGWPCIYRSSNLEVPEAPPVGAVLGGVVGAGDEAGLAERQVEQVVPAERPERRPLVVALLPALAAGRPRTLELGEGVVEGELPRISAQRGGFHALVLQDIVVNGRVRVMT